MKTLKLVELFETFGQVQGYLDAVTKTYERTNQPYTADYGVDEVEGELLFKTQVIVYEKGSKEKDKL
jgi:hypothetical protein